MPRAVDELRLITPNLAQSITSSVWHKTWWRTQAWMPEDEPPRTFCGRRIKGYWDLGPVSRRNTDQWYCRQCKAVEDRVLEGER